MRLMGFASCCQRVFAHALAKKGNVISAIPSTTHLTIALFAARTGYVGVAQLSSAETDGGLVLASTVFFGPLEPAN